MSSREHWGRAIPKLSDEGLLLVEMSHRVANEVTSSLAALHLALAGRGPPRKDVIKWAISRLEGFSGVLSVLNSPPGRTVDLSCALDRICVGLCAGRRHVEGSQVTIDVSEVWADAATARAIVMTAAELVNNSIRHALETRAGCLSVLLRHDGDGIRLVVADDGPGIRPGAASSGTGMGTPIVAEILRRIGGTIDVQTGAGGTTMLVHVPTFASAGEARA